MSIFYEKDPSFPLCDLLAYSQRIVHFCFSAKGFSRLSGGWIRGSLVPFCVQYSFNLNGIIKENNFNHYITATAQAVKLTDFTWISTARSTTFWERDLNEFQAPWHFKPHWSSKFTLQFIKILTSCGFSLYEENSQFRSCKVLSGNANACVNGFVYSLNTVCGILVQTYIDSRSMFVLPYREIRELPLKLTDFWNNRSGVSITSPNYCDFGWTIFFFDRKDYSFRLVAPVEAI